MGVPDHQTYGNLPGDASVLADVPTKRKRKQVGTYMEDTDDSVQYLGAGKKGDKTKQLDGIGAHDACDAPKSKKKRTKKDPNEPAVEKRLRQTRQKAPQAYLEIKGRALTQRMFVLDRTRGGTPDLPEEIVQIAGTTGNVYTVRINQTPTCSCPHAAKGNQCKHVIYVMLRVLKAREEIAYQLALLSSELREVFEHAPPIPSADASDSSSDGNRKAVEDECPICCVEFESAKEEIVWCKAACGNNIHKTCFDKWAVAKRASGKVTCPFCRSPWAQDDVSLKNIPTNGVVNEDGYVNIAGQLGISGERDYSSYHQYWVNREARAGRIGIQHYR